MTLKKTTINAYNHNNLDLNLKKKIEEMDLKFMKLALKQAELSKEMGEVPIGAIIVDKNGKILSKSTNIREKVKTTLGHAELVAIHRACRKLDSWRLIGCTLYISLEPCFMCAGALVQSRISRVVFGATDPKGGALVSLAKLGNDTRLNHQFEIVGGVLADESSLLLKNFFKSRRKK